MSDEDDRFPGDAFVDYSRLSSADAATAARWYLESTHGGDHPSTELAGFASQILRVILRRLGHGAVTVDGRWLVSMDEHGGLSVKEVGCG